jgi:GTPase SAR1 family protein
MVYDVNKKSTFDSIMNYWLPQFRDVATDSTSIILVGNQIDRCQLNEDFREVPTEVASQFA